MQPSGPGHPPISARAKGSQIAHRHVRLCNSQLRQVRFAGVLSRAYAATTDRAADTDRDKSLLDTRRVPSSTRPRPES